MGPVAAPAAAAVDSSLELRWVAQQAQGRQRWDWQWDAWDVGVPTTPGSATKVPLLQAAVVKRDY